MELGRIDIAYKVSSLSKFLARPRTGHTYQALPIFKYLEVYIDNDFSFDPLYQDIQHPQDLEVLIREMNVETAEDLQTNPPLPQ